MVDAFVEKVVVWDGKEVEIQGSIYSLVIL